MSQIDPIETVMEQACTLCHRPYVETDQQVLDDLCAECPIEKALRQALSGGAN